MRWNFVSVISVLLLVISVSGCDHGDHLSGVHGLALQEWIGGAYPPPPPVIKPLPGATILIESESGGKVLAQQVSDSEGRFEIDLSPGVYLLVPIKPPDNGYVMDAPQQTIVVSPHSFTDVEVKFIVPLP